MGYRHAMEYFSAIKRYEVLTAATTRISLKTTTQSERSPSHTSHILYDSTRAECPNRSCGETERRLVVAGDRGEVTVESHSLIGPGCSCEVMKMFQSYLEMLVAQLHERTKAAEGYNLKTVHFVFMNFTSIKKSISSSVSLPYFKCSVAMATMLGNTDGEHLRYGRRFTRQC